MSPPPLLFWLQFARFKMMKIKQIIESITRENSWFHAYLFVGGTREVHEEIVENIVAKRNCFASDISIVEPIEGSGKAGEIKADQIRALIHDLTLSSHGTGRVAVIYQAERLNLSSSNTLLKTLEEPPRNTVILLFSTSDALLSTIKSRCRVVRIPTLDDPAGNNYDVETMIKKSFFEISGQVEKIVKDEDIYNFLDELRAYLRTKMLQRSDPKYVRLLKKLEKTRREIKMNANAKLALEALLIIIKEITKNEK